MTCCPPHILARNVYLVDKIDDLFNEDLNISLIIIQTQIEAEILLTVQFLLSIFTFLKFKKIPKCPLLRQLCENLEIDCSVLDIVAAGKQANIIPEKDDETAIRERIAEKQAHDFTMPDS